MKKDVGLALKERNRPELFTEHNYGVVRAVMVLGMKSDKMLKSYLSISPDFKVNWIADHIIKLHDAGLLNKI